MNRIWHRNIYLQSKCVFPQILHKDILSHLKILNNYRYDIKRQYANKSETTEVNNLELVYQGPLKPQIRAVKIFSITSSAAGLAAQPIIINQASEIGSTSLLIAMCSVVGFFTFITPILLHLVTKKYVTEMHYDPITATYKATTISFFLVPMQLDFKAEDVEVPDIPGMFTTMKAKGKALFIEARHFSDPQHYAKIMGYDKPLDFKLGNVDNDGSNRSK